MPLIQAFDKDNRDLLRSVGSKDNGDGTWSLLTSPAGAEAVQTQENIEAISINLGAREDTRATWYTDAVSFISLFKLAVAVFVGAGSHAFGYNGSGQLLTDTWTLFGTVRVKTYTYNADGTIATETDWV